MSAHGGDDADRMLVRDASAEDPFATSRPRRRRAGPEVYAAVAAGGALGGGLRHLCGRLAAEVGVDQVAMIAVINIVGSLLLAALVVLIERRPAPRLSRPFLGTGVLGGFTTFSTAQLNLHDLIAAGHAVEAIALLTATPLAALVAAWVGHVGARRLVTRRNP